MKSKKHHKGCVRLGYGFAAVLVLAGCGGSGGMEETGLDVPDVPAPEQESDHDDSERERILGEPTDPRGKVYEIISHEQGAEIRQYLIFEPGHGALAADAHALVDTGDCFGLPDASVVNAPAHGQQLVEAGGSELVMNLNLLDSRELNQWGTIGWDWSVSWSLDDEGHISSIRLLDVAGDVITAAQEGDEALRYAWEDAGKSVSIAIPFRPVADLTPDAILSEQCPPALTEPNVYAGFSTERPAQNPEDLATRFDFAYALLISADRFDLAKFGMSLGAEGYRYIGLMEHEGADGSVCLRLRWEAVLTYDYRTQGYDGYYDLTSPGPLLDYVVFTLNEDGAVTESSSDTLKVAPSDVSWGEIESRLCDPFS